jgi:hypothetical protein
MNDREPDAGVAAALEDLHRRRALGESPDPTDYRARLGDEFPEFVAVLRAEDAIDEALATPPAEVLPRVFGGYTLLRELGRGAAGVVYEALQRDLGRNVALKILRTGFDTDATALERFRREARACARVRHDHVVEIHEAGEAEGRPYYAMTLVEGRTLAAAIREGAVPSPAALAEALAGIADALQALHDAGVVHRDVKPSNIVVRRDGRMLLADFGLARSAGAQSLTSTGHALGTPMYMSPEQVLGQRDEVDARTDVYGLGATLYEALTGKPPFSADELHALLRQILTNRPADPRTLAPHVPPGLEAIALKALEKRREDRYPSAAAVARDLRAFAAGGRVEGRPVPPALRLVRAARARWIPIAVGGALFAGAVLWWTGRPATLRVKVGIPPQARIWVDGREVGTGTAEVRVSPGEHAVTVRAPKFKDDLVRRRLDPGETWTREFNLAPTDPSDPEALNTILAALGLPAAAPVAVETVRGGDDGEASPVFPAGDVRLEGLGEYRVDVGPSFPGPAKLRFLRGATVLHESDFAPADTGPHTARVPDEVVRALRPGDAVTWGLFWNEQPREGSVASFRVVDRPDATREIARIEGHAGVAAQPDLVKDLIVARALVAHGLHAEALSTYVAIVGQDPSVRPAWEGIVSALRALGRHDAPLHAEASDALREGRPPPPADAPPYASVRGPRGRPASR